MQMKFVGRGLLFSIFYSVLLVSSGLSAQNNQTLVSHEKSRKLNREGYQAYLQRNWDLALKKFSQSIRFDPYYTYPVYNSACVLSRRGRSEDSLRIFRLLMEVLLQETGPSRSVHQAKMQKDPDLAWFRRTEPELFIALNDVVLDYNVRRIYRKLWQRKTWDIEVGNRRFDGSRDYWDDKIESEESILDGEVEPEEAFGDDEIESITVTPDDEPMDSPMKSSGRVSRERGSLGRDSEERGTREDLESSNADEEENDFKQEKNLLPADNPFSPSPEVEGKKDDSKQEKAPAPADNPFSPSSSDFDPFSDADDSNPFGNPEGFPGYDEEGSEEFFPLVPQSLYQEYQDSVLTLNLISQQANSSSDVNFITFDGYRYKWNFRVGRYLFEMSGFFVVRGNVLILETFASSPKELRGLPFDWGAFRSIFFVYQPQNDEFYAINLSGDKIEIY